MLRRKKDFTSCIQLLEGKDIIIRRIATDRHVSITSSMAKDHPNMGDKTKWVIKKLTYKANQRGCEDLSPWIQSISNHLWWSVATCNGNISDFRENGSWSWITSLISTSNQEILVFTNAVTTLFLPLKLRKSDETWLNVQNYSILTPEFPFNGPSWVLIFSLRYEWKDKSCVVSERIWKFQVGRWFK